MIKLFTGIRLFGLCLGLLLLATLRPAGAAPVYVRFNTNLGNIDVELFADTTPNTVANFLSYANGVGSAAAAYTNVIINRSVQGFVIQAGGFNLVSNSIAAIPLDRDYTANPLVGEPGISNTRGTLAMALSTGPDSGTNQWFFNEGDNSATLDGAADGGPFTVFGQVMNTSSLSVMDAISNVTVYVPPNNPFIGPPPADQNPNDYAFGDVPLIGYTPSGNESNPTPVQVANLVLISSITTLTNVQDFPTWQNTYFSGQPAGNSAPTATPLNDGVPNLLKYVFDINPAIPMTAAVRARLPTVGKTTISGTTYMTLTYYQHNALIGVTVNVQTSPDLQTWTTVANPIIVQTGTDSGTGDPILQARVAATGTRQFIRLNVTQP